jgi:hypothetical protein
LYCPRTYARFWVTGWARGAAAATAVCRLCAFEMCGVRLCCAYVGCGGRARLCVHVATTLRGASTPSISDSNLVTQLGDERVGSLLLGVIHGADIRVDGRVEGLPQRTARECAARRAVARRTCRPVRHWWAQGKEFYFHSSIQAGRGGGHHDRIWRYRYPRRASDGTTRLVYRTLYGTYPLYGAMRADLSTSPEKASSGDVESRKKKVRYCHPEHGGMLGSTGHAHQPPGYTLKASGCTTHCVVC